MLGARVGQMITRQPTRFGGGFEETKLRGDALLLRFVVVECCQRRWWTMIHCHIRLTVIHYGPPPFQDVMTSARHLFLIFSFNSLSVSSSSSSSNIISCAQPDHLVHIAASLSRERYHILASLPSTLTTFSCTVAVGVLSVLSSSSSINREFFDSRSVTDPNFPLISSLVAFNWAICLSSASLAVRAVRSSSRSVLRSVLPLR